MANILEGYDSEGYEDYCEEVHNLIKNNWRGPTIAAGIQPGMLFSRSTDDRLTHRASAAQDYLIFQGDPVCAANEVVCADNSVVVTLPV